MLELLDRVFHVVPQVPKEVPGFQASRALMVMDQVLTFQVGVKDLE